MWCDWLSTGILTSKEAAKSPVYPGANPGGGEVDDFNSVFKLQTYQASFWVPEFSVDSTQNPTSTLSQRKG